jgi:hypothetical protein
MNSCMTECLNLCEAYLSVCQNLTEKLCLEKKEYSIYTDVSWSISCICALIVAGSFAAAFTPSWRTIWLRGLKLHLVLLLHDCNISAYACQSNKYKHGNSPLLPFHFYWTGFYGNFLYDLNICEHGTTNVGPWKVLGRFHFGHDPQIGERTSEFCCLFSLSILIMPTCLQILRQMPMSKHKLKDILKVLVASIVPLMLLHMFISLAQDLVQGHVWYTIGCKIFLEFKGQRTPDPLALQKINKTECTTIRVQNALRNQVVSTLVGLIMMSHWHVMVWIRIWNISVVLLLSILCGESRLLISWCVSGRCDMAGSDEDLGRSRRPGAEDRE